jgi:hypothetical protein
LENSLSTKKSVGIVVPTLGLRIDYLLQCLHSIRAIEDAYILLVAPLEAHKALLDYSEFFDQLEADPGAGLAAAINYGAKKLPRQIEIFNWLGDDDLLLDDGFKKSFAEISSNPDCVATFGISNFIDENGEEFSKSTLGKHAVQLLLIGPNKIPQPGALIRRSTFNAIGGLNTNLGWAFDYDMFIRLSRVGEVKFIAEQVSKYRWHSTSLSASQTQSSILEASKVRRENLPKLLRLFSLLWEIPHVALAIILSKRLTKLALRNPKTQDFK